jgi:hypothetical protein
VQPVDDRSNLAFRDRKRVVPSLTFEDTFGFVAERPPPNLLPRDAYWFLACSNLAVYGREDSQFWRGHPFLIANFKNPIVANSYSSIRAISAFEVFYETCDVRVIGEEAFCIVTNYVEEFAACDYLELVFFPNRFCTCRIANVGELNAELRAHSG